MNAAPIRICFNFFVDVMVSIPLFKIRNTREELNPNEESYK
jgi:hypothetical protein